MTGGTAGEGQEVVLGMTSGTAEGTVALVVVGVTGVAGNPHTFACQMCRTGQHCVTHYVHTEHHVKQGVAAPV